MSQQGVAEPAPAPGSAHHEGFDPANGIGNATQDRASGLFTVPGEEPQTGVKIRSSASLSPLLIRSRHVPPVIGHGLFRRLVEWPQVFTRSSSEQASGLRALIQLLTTTRVPGGACVTCSCALTSARRTRVVPIPRP